MKKALKIVTIGGGSSYTPELIEGFIKRYPELPIAEHWLVDIDEGAEKLRVVAELAQRMWDASGYLVKIRTTLDRREALPGADFVTTQFRVGLLPARIKDERIPDLHGMLGQETNGAGGIFKAFRTIPVIGQIIADMRELCPDAWLINFTNPSGMVTEAAIKKFGWKKTIGLCNVPVIAEMREHENIGVERDYLTYQFAGLNHFHWHRVFDREGKNVTASILPYVNTENGGTPVNIFQSPFPQELLDSLGDIPCGYHRYYFMEEEMLEHSMEDFRRHGTRAEMMYQVEHELFEIYKQPGLHEKPAQLAKRGGAYYSDAACECISAIYNDKHLRMTVSTENQGAISCLPEDSIVECSCLISAQGAEPLAWGKMRPFERGWLQFMKAMEECVIEAAITGDYGMALEAFTMNPLVRSGEEGRRVLDEMLVAHEKYLPQFAEKIRQLKEAGVCTQDEVVQDLIRKGL